MCSVHEMPTFAHPGNGFVKEAQLQVEVIPLEPVDAVAITSICDNTVDTSCSWTRGLPTVSWDV